MWFKNEAYRLICKLQLGAFAGGLTCVFSDARAQAFDAFKTRDIDVHLYQEKPTPVSSEEDFSDENSNDESLETIEPDELEYLSESAVQEC